MATSPLKSDMAPAFTATQNHVHPKKLLLSKWTAVEPTRKEKHFWVVKVVEPQEPGDPIVEVVLEAAMTGRTLCIAWRALKDRQNWRQGWV